MRLELFTLFLLSCAAPLLAQNVTCPTPPTPTAWPTASSFPLVSTLPDPFNYLYPSTARVASNAEWDIGTLVAWAWGFHRVLDALIFTAPEIDSTLVGVTGCSRLGKAALAAGLFDTRITLTMPMSSGVQGLGPYRYSTLSGQGENLENSKQGAPWWSNSALGTFINQSNRVPFDAHVIAAAIAPRALVIDQGSSDPFVNSRGTATVIFPAAQAVYDWLGVGPNIGLAMRSGGHCDMSGYTNVLPFVLKILKGTPTTRTYTDMTPWQAIPTAYPWTSNIPPK
ncbi:unnamed protein product [Cyclocybe aegerita]|uniref:(4-O-methyl)-D-glucuronate--lignin esterase n=1 Tax=Cyclocybe aegerita TaxID=1973307 RepID=A0A8S0W359_CYCAE|nr:unnamed protein product [Cyclocybe aegerita]